MSTESDDAQKVAEPTSGGGQRMEDKHNETVLLRRLADHVSPFVAERIKGGPLQESEAQEFIAKRVNELLNKKLLYYAAGLGLGSLAALGVTAKLIYGKINDEVDKQVTAAIEKHDAQLEASIAKQKEYTYGSLQELVKSAQKSAEDAVGQQKYAEGILSQVNSQILAVEGQSKELQRQLAVFSNDSQNQRVLKFVNDTKALLDSKGGEGESLPVFMKRTNESLAKEDGDIASLRTTLEKKADAAATDSVLNDIQSNLEAFKKERIADSGDVRGQIDNVWKATEKTTLTLSGHVEDVNRYYWAWVDEISKKVYAAPPAPAPVSAPPARPPDTDYRAIHAK